jgi:ribosome-associated toxin RatA of RatAB toxin-antitoxin module
MAFNIFGKGLRRPIDHSIHRDRVPRSVGGHNQAPQLRQVRTVREIDRAGYQEAGRPDGVLERLRQGLQSLDRMPALAGGYGSVPPELAPKGGWRLHMSDQGRPSGGPGGPGGVGSGLGSRGTDRIEVTAQKRLVLAEASRFVPVPPEDIYRVVADVRAYPELLGKGLDAVTILQQRGERQMDAEFEVSLRVGPIALNRDRYAIGLELSPHHRVSWDLLPGRGGPFQVNRGRWDFQPVDGGTRLAYEAAIQLKSRLIPVRVAQQFARGNLSDMLNAFAGRASAPGG